MLLCKTHFGQLEFQNKQNKVVRKLREISAYHRSTSQRCDALDARAKFRMLAAFVFQDDGYLPFYFGSNLRGIIDLLLFSV